MSYADSGSLGVILRSAAILAASQGSLERCCRPAPPDMPRTRRECPAVAFLCLLQASCCLVGYRYRFENEGAYSSIQYHGLSIERWHRCRFRNATAGHSLRNLGILGVAERQQIYPLFLQAGRDACDPGIICHPLTGSAPPQYRPCSFHLSCPGSVYRHHPCSRDQGCRADRLSHPAGSKMCRRRRDRPEF